MSTYDASTTETTPTTAQRHGLLLATLTAAIFLSAALLFAVQPMFTKMVIPRLGGAPAVWSVAIANGWGRPPAVGEAFWLIGLFAVSIGLPFFALAANSPLLQAWFARTDHPAAKDPYFLYAASNVGSFLALVSYPIVIEPFVRLGDQAWSWSIGFCFLIALLAACGALRWRAPDEDARAGGAADTPPTWKDAGFWVALAAVPAGLLVAVTAHISTDVAAVPLLWVLPLALYLL